jgi:23S rRNA (adenine2030-N6)-methyltransferase
MAYIHFGRIGDIWKHLPLCSFLEIEKPEIYIESNSAYANYQLSETSEQRYGIYTFYEKSIESGILINTPFYKIIKKNMANSLYSGSPALAMEVLSGISKKYIFFDLDKDGLNSIKEYSIKNKMENKILTRNEDSISGILNLPEGFSGNVFIHFDPYFIFDKNDNNETFFDAFLKASERNIKCMFWYGYNTLEEKKIINDTIRQKINEKKLDKNIKSVEIMLKNIDNPDNNLNPGIMACGVMISNLSAESYNLMDILSDELVKIYKDVNLKENVSGELIKDVIIF